MQCDACGYENDEGQSHCINCGFRLAPSAEIASDGERQSFGRYTLFDEIGHGSMARVRRAWDMRLQREVAIKQPIFDAGISQAKRNELNRRFLIEGQAAARLSHQNIVHVYSADVYSDTPFIVMELVKGRPLSQLLSSHGCLSPTFALMLLDQLLDAVGCVHEHGIVHRDIKPDNIYVTDDHVLKLGDFGIAHLDDMGATVRTAAGVMLGTPGYMSPEQVEGQRIDARSDIFSVGAVAYEMLTGRNPFGASDDISLATLFQRILSTSTDSQTDEFLRQRVPNHVVRAIMAALSQSPEMRPQSANEFKSMLHGVTTAASKFGNSIDAAADRPQEAYELPAYESPKGYGGIGSRLHGASSWSFYMITGGILVIMLSIILTNALSGATGWSSSGGVVPQASEILSVSVGDTIELGTYNNMPIRWTCVLIDENGPLMLSQDILCYKAFDAAGSSETYHTDGWGAVRTELGSNCWQDSSLRQWLNSSGQVSWTHCPPTATAVLDGENPYVDEDGFLTGFKESELEYVKDVEHRVYVNTYETHRDGYHDGGTEKQNQYYGDLALLPSDTSWFWYKTLRDKFFLLNYDQVRNIYIASDASRELLLSQDNPWWTGDAVDYLASFENEHVVDAKRVRDPDLDYGYAAAYDGSIGVRPAFYLNVPD